MEISFKPMTDLNVSKLKRILQSGRYKFTETECLTRRRGEYEKKESCESDPHRCSISFDGERMVANILLCYAIQEGIISYADDWRYIRVIKKDNKIEVINFKKEIKKEPTPTEEETIDIFKKFEMGESIGYIKRKYPKFSEKTINDVIYHQRKIKDEEWKNKFKNKIKGVN